MSFGAPTVLLALLALPVLAALYGREQGRRRAAAAAFVKPRMQRSVAPRRPGWRRHAPIIALGLALTVLIGAAAKPERTVAVPVERASIMLVTDVSGSMQATDVRPSRLAAAREAARTFVGKVPHGVRIGVMAFNQHPRTLQPPTGDHGAARDALAQLASSGGTRTGDALDSALTVLERQPGVNGKRPPAAIVLLSDGKSTAGEDPILLAQRAQRDHIPIYTVALGTASGTIRVPRPGGASGLETRPVPPDPQTLSEIARISGGQAYSAEDENQLSTVYHHLGSQLGRKKAPREITAGFVGGAVALLALAGALSLRWFGRLP
jgi:Ca-activated chloride channel family protein